MNANPNYLSPPLAQCRDAPDATNRTPSPTSSEIAALGRFNYRSMFQRDKVFTKKYLICYLVGVAVIILSALTFIYNKQIVHAIQPTADGIHGLPGGWFIPITVFFIISFPPLFGHEILALVCGLVWGVWAGFGITAAGTVLGEIGNFYAFRSIFWSRAKKLETKNIQYAYLAKLVREGGFVFVLIVRYSVIPGHFATAIFSVCGLNIYVFILAAILSTPKQFIIVYLGSLMKSRASGTTSTRSTIISLVVTAVTVIVTVAAMWYIRKEVNRVKPDVIYARRKARQAKKAERRRSVHLVISSD